MIGRVLFFFEVIIVDFWFFSSQAVFFSFLKVLK